MTNRFVRIISFAVLLGSLAYLALKSVFSSDPPSDYQFIWLAGDIWWSGLDPYSAIYFELGEKRFVGMNRPQYWFYPPNWWLVTRLSALTSFETGLIIWRGFGALCLVLGTLIAAHSIQRNVIPLSNLRVSAAIALVCLMSATPIAMALGQTTFLSFLGLCLFITAYLSGQRLLMIVAVTVLMLKPQIGLPFCFFLLANRQWITSLIGAAFLSILAAAPAFLYVDLLTFLDAYVVQFGLHNDLDPNHPRAMTGLRNLAYDLGGARLSTLPLTAFAAIVAFFIGLLSDAQSKSAAHKLALLIATMTLIVPLHTYDMMLLVPLVLLAAAMPAAGQLVLFIGILLIFRANNLAAITGFYDQTTTHFIGSRITSAGLVAVLIGTIIGVGTYLRRTGASNHIEQSN